MDILFVGYSSIVQRKVLPAAIKAKNIERISFASKKHLDLTKITEFNIGHIYDNYEEAILKTGNSIVYISFPNALHALWAEKALLAGHHVVVDKPAFMSYEEARMLTGIANRNNLLLAEANVWTYHFLFKEIKKYIENKVVHSVYVNFSSPPLEPSNFRYNPDMGAGILLDRGSYAVSCVRELFPNLPENIFCSQRFSESLTDVDTDISIVMNFSDRSTFLGFFSLECEYTNTLVIIGQDFRITANRIFTPPPDKKLDLEIMHNNTLSKINTLPCDAFQEFLDDVVNSIQNCTHERFSRILLNDAELFARLEASHQ